VLLACDGDRQPLDPASRRRCASPLDEDGISRADGDVAQEWFVEARVEPRHTVTPCLLGGR